MAPTLVNAALGALLAAALLGAAFDRRSVAVVVAAAVVPSADAAASLVITGATNTVLHTVWLPLAVGGLIYWDTTRRESSWLRERYGWRGVRVGWVALTAFVAAGIAPEAVGDPGANLLYPVDDAYYVIDGLLLFSTQDGVVQTFVSATAEEPGLLPFESRGTTETHAIATWVNPDGRPGVGGGDERVLTLVETGWQAVVVAAAGASLAVRFRPWSSDSGEKATTASPSEDPPISRVNE